MGRRVYLHIGTMKSATSYLAQLCELNSEYLSNNGLLWPMAGLRYCAIRDFYGRQVREVDFTGTWRTLLRQMADFPGDVLLSNEMLAALNVAQISRLARAFAEAELHVVLTARDLARVIPSHWQTTLKNGRTDTWPDFAAAVCVDRPEPVSTEEESAPASDEAGALTANTYDWFWRRHDVAAILRRWSDVAPPERTSVVTVPPSGSDPELVAKRFGSVIGLDLTGLEQPEWSNPSLGAHSAELLRRLNMQMKDLTPAERSYGARGALAGSLALERARVEPKFGLNQEQQDWTRARASQMIRQIEQLGVQVVGDLADLIPAEQPPAGCVDPTDSAESELLAAAAHGLKGMVKGYTEVRLEKRDQAVQLAELKTKSEQLQERVERQRKRIDALLSERKDRGQRGSSLPNRLRRLARRNPRMRSLVSRFRSASRR
jgi:hypothetical protein